MLTLEPVAHIHSDFPTKFGIPRQSGLVEELEALVVFEPSWRDDNALRGIEGFSHLWLIWEFSEAVGKGWHPTVRPPRLGGNQRMGVFATRSPFRPNPIGLSCVRLEKVELDGPDGPVLYVTGADMMSGTPIYDIKPYLPYVDSIPQARGGFASRVKEYALEVEISGACLEKIPVSERETLRQILSQDPRPSYQDDPERMYGMGYAGMEVKFQVKDGRLLVRDIETASKDPAQEEKGRK